MSATSTSNLCKPSLWKRMLSYFHELDIEETSSTHNPHLYLTLNKGRYQLATDNAIYSYCDLYDNFSKSFDAIDLDLQGIDNVLILGFGLGSIPYMLEKVFNKNYEYTAVEIDEKVIQLAQKYILPELKSSIDIIHKDALQFVKTCKNKFDLIAMDIFIDDVIPDSFEHIDYLHNLQNLLKPEGLLLYNRLSLDKDDAQKTKSFYENTFSNVFPNSTYLDAQGNWMLMNKNDVMRAI